MSDEWAETTLGDHLTRVRRKVAVQNGVEYPAVSVQMYGRGLGQKEPFIGGESKYTTLFEVHKSDVVLRTITAFEAPAAVAGPEHQGAHVSGVFFTYEVGKRVLPEFLALFFQTQAFWDQMNNRASGTVLRRKTISDDAFRGIPLALAPLPVQERIVEVAGALDDQIAALGDEAEASTAMHGRLIDDSISQHSASWPTVSIGDVAEVLIGFAFKSSVFKGAREGRRLLRGINLGPNGTKWADTDTVLWPESEHAPYAKYDLVPGDVCIAMDRPFTRTRNLRCAQIAESDLPALVVQRVARLRPRRDIIHPGFLLNIVRSGPMAEHLAGRQTDAGYAPHISGSDISTFEFGLPSPAQQSHLAAVFASIDEQTAASRAETSRLRAVRAALLSALLSREIEIAEAERTVA